MSRHNTAPSTTLFAASALLPEGWKKNVRLTITDGMIAAVEQDARLSAGDTGVATLLPALANAHSHTFQRAMAGMTELRGPNPDSFWTWRDLMYRFLGYLTPSDFNAIAAMAFLEMQEAGYASVAEFHYVHHQPGGETYANPAELSDQVLAAAHATGIGLTHLPVLYCYGGAGEKPLASGQLRFGNTLETYASLIAAIETSMARHMPADVRLGMAPHSLRAVSPDIFTQLGKLSARFPIHIHIAEQVKEVEDVKAWLGATPVQWLMDHQPVNQQWCLIHATHMTFAETLALAGSGAVAGLCPVTEANLGDGIFNGPDYIKAGGAYAIGTDSNIAISVAGELRMLEYSQRLAHRARNVMASHAGSTGQQLYTAAAHGGAQSLGRNCGTIEAGKLADLVAIDRRHPSLEALTPDQLLDGWIFAMTDNPVTDVWSAGRHCVRSGRHIARDSIVATYQRCLIDLVARL